MVISFLSSFSGCPPLSPLSGCDILKALEHLKPSKSVGDVKIHGSVINSCYNIFVAVTGRGHP
jgi:hypothetical protein